VEVSCHCLHSYCDHCWYPHCHHLLPHCCFHSRVEGAAAWHGTIFIIAVGICENKINVLAPVVIGDACPGARVKTVVFNFSSVHFSSFCCVGFPASRLACLPAKVILVVACAMGNAPVVALGTPVPFHTVNRLGFQLPPDRRLCFPCCFGSLSSPSLTSAFGAFVPPFSTLVAVDLLNCSSPAL
jgi:hypothetical protein